MRYKAVIMFIMLFAAAMFALPACEQLDLHAPAIETASDTVQAVGEAVAPVTGGASVPIAYALTTIAAAVIALNRQLLLMKAKRVIEAADDAPNSPPLKEQMPDPATKAAVRQLLR